MTQANDYPTDRVRLEVLIDQAVAALTALDAEAIEDLSEACRHADPPGSAAEWERARSGRWVLGHLIEQTGCRLAILRRLSGPAARFGAYGEETIKRAAQPATEPVSRLPG